MNKAKYKWILLIVVVLLISNIILAFFLFTSREEQFDKKKKNEMQALAIYKEIGLTAEQIEIFKSKKEIFFDEMRPLWDEIKTLKDSLYKNMDKDSTNSSIISLTQVISDKTRQVDLKMYQHFVEIRKLCTSEQQVRFDTIVPKFLNKTWKGNKK